LAISIVSVLYNGAEGAISIGFGAESSSRSLIFFGIQSGIEVISACLVIWRFRHVAQPGEERMDVLDAHSLRFEKRATIGIGALLLALSISTEATAIYVLALRKEPDESNASLVISATCLVIMVLIWLPKRYLARALNSSTMQGEATCSLSCIQITCVLFLGSLLFRVWHAGWWVDGATSLVLGLLFAWEGVKMERWALDPKFTGGCCKDCQPHAVPERHPSGESSGGCDCCEEKPERSTAKSSMPECATKQDDSPVPDRSVSSNGCDNALESVVGAAEPQHDAEKKSCCSHC